MTTFYLVRHGVTDHTHHRLSGWLPDIHLSEEGVAQAEAAAGSLAPLRLRAIYSSPIDRTAETARIIAGRHKLPVKVRRDIGEVDYGRWTNRSLRAVARTKLWTTLQRWPAGARFPEGEALRDVQVRSVRAVEELRTKHPRGAVCVVTHGEVIRLVAAHYMGVHVDLFQRLMVGPASITVIAVDDSGPRILALNVPPGAPLRQR